MDVEEVKRQLESWDTSGKVVRITIIPRKEHNDEEHYDSEKIIRENQVCFIGGIFMGLVLAFMIGCMGWVSGKSMLDNLLLIISIIISAIGVYIVQRGGKKNGRKSGETSNRN